MLTIPSQPGIKQSGCSGQRRMRCPHCRSLRIKRIESRYHCAVCRKKFSKYSHTWLRHKKLPTKTILAILSCWLKGYPVNTAHDLCGASIPTIRRYYRLFRLNVVKSSDFKPESHIQADEAYFGRFRKSANYYHSVRRYEVMNKVCVFGMVCPNTGQLFTRVVHRRPGQIIKSIIRRYIPPSVAVYSDKSPYYTHLNNTHTHYRRSHDQGFEYSQYIESCWSWMKRMLFKQYHHFTKRYAKEYVAELTWKFNTRKTIKDPLDILKNSLWAVPTD